MSRETELRMCLSLPLLLGVSLPSLASRQPGGAAVLLRAEWRFKMDAKRG